MCLSVPGKIVSIDGTCARVMIGEVACDACTKLVDDLSPGDWVLIHTGFVIEKLSPEKADEILKIINEIFCAGSSNDSNDP